MLSVCSFSQDQPANTASPAARAELIRIVTGQLAAIGRGDMDTYGKDMAEELIYIPSDGGLYSKEQILARTLRYFKAGVGKKFDDLQDVQVIENGDSAILTGKVMEHVIYGEREFAERFQRSEHFVRRDGRWQAVLIQFTLIPENHRTPVKIDPKRLDECGGRYAWTEGLINTITKEDGKLLSQFRKEGTKVELLPLNDTTFFTRDDLSETIFMKDRHGRVTHYVYRRPDGQEVCAQRID